MIKIIKAQKTKIYKFMTVNQRVLGSSPRGGAKQWKPWEIRAFFSYALFISKYSFLLKILNKELG